MRTGFVPARVLILSVALTGGVLAARPGTQAAAPPGVVPGAPVAPPADPDPWCPRQAYTIPISWQALAEQGGMLYSFGGVR